MNTRLPDGALARAGAALIFALALVLAGCDGDGDGGGHAGPAPTTDDGSPAAQADGTGSGGGGGQPVEPAPEPSAAVATFLAELQQARSEHESLSADDLLAAHALAPELALDGISFDPMAAERTQLVADGLQLETEEKAALSEQGFVISGRLQYEAYGQAYLDIYRLDLPVLITADSVLHAMHRSFDAILANVEEQRLFPALETVLQDAHAWLAQPAGAPGLDEARADADLYLAVARSLLADEDVAPQEPSLAGMVAELVALARAEKFAQVSLFDRPRKIDFSQMTPRGHYEGHPVLERYFRAMMWLGRVDFRPVDQSQEAVDQSLEYVKRQLLGAAVLTDALRESGALATWEAVDGLLGAFFGQRDSLGPPGMVKLMADLEVRDAAQLASLDDTTVQAALQRGGYGEQRIRSHWIETDPFSTETAPLPVSFLVLGQRFTLDSHVFSNVVYDSILHEGTKVPRVLPSPLDVLFVLGNDAALPHLQKELEQYPYQGNLATLRWYTDGYDDDFWGESLYSAWLAAIRGLNPSMQDAANLPETLRTERWQRKLMHTQLTSWAQLRHDTILYAKQSYTGGVACEYPAGYVEPYPEVYARIGAFMQMMATRLKGDALAGQSQWVVGHLERFAETAGQLQILAQKELDHEPFDDEEVAWIKTLIDSDPGCGAPVYGGWYTNLFINGDDVALADHIIADVHTNPNMGPLPGPNVLHVATGDVHLMVLSIDTCDGPQTFVGPVQSYHEVDVPEIKRLTDSDWAQRFRSEGAGVPDFERPLWVDPPTGP